MKPIYVLLLISLLQIGINATLGAQCNDVSIPDGTVEYLGNQHDFLKSIGNFNNGCTGTFIKTSTNPNAPAYVLSNGHCVRELTSENRNTILTDYTLADSNAVVVFNYFDNTQTEFINVKIDKIEYASMKGVDIVIARLDKTIGEMAALGLEPIPISQENFSLGDTVKIPGAPVGGFLRMTSGNITGFSSLVVENGWVWYDMIENECENIGPGSSGSPVFSCFGNGLYGVINTTNVDGFTPCDLNSPCEVAGLIPEYDVPTNYVVDVRNILNCFNDQGVFDMSLPNFPLDKGDQIHLEYLGLMPGLINNFINPDLPRSTKTLKVDLSGKDYYRYKFKAVDQSYPTDIADFSDVIQTSTAPSILDSIPNEEGLYILSVIGGDTPVFDSSWQQVEKASFFVIIVDKTAPTELPEIVNEGTESDDFYFIVIGNITSFLTYGVSKAYGGLDFDENDRSNYPLFSFNRAALSKEEGPYKYCAFFTDRAGNMGPINCEIFGATTSIDAPEIDENVLVYPNPATELLTIETKGQSMVQYVALYDLVGNQLLKEVDAGTKFKRINVATFPTGVYYLQIQTNFGSITKKLFLK